MLLVYVVKIVVKSPDGYACSSSMHSYAASVVKIVVKALA
jgi:hypothetical protein